MKVHIDHHYDQPRKFGVAVSTHSEELLLALKRIAKDESVAAGDRIQAAIAAFNHLEQRL